MSLIDISHQLWPGMPKIPILPEVERHQVASIADGAPLNISAITLALHVGTHIDAPAHAVDGAKTIDELPIERFAGTAVVGSSAGTGVPVSSILVWLLMPPPPRCCGTGCRRSRRRSRTT